MSYTAIVPARSGSKRLPHKNIKFLGDKPLLVWTLEACIQAEYVTEVILSTDSMEYWETSRKYLQSEKLSLDLRDSDEAGDTIKIFDYIKHKRSKLFGLREGNFVLALPTVPLRRSNHVNEAIALFESSGCPVFSATNYGFPVSFAFHMREPNLWDPVFTDSPMLTGNTRSQNQGDSFHPNGAIYVRPIDDLARPDLKTLYDGAVPYFMSREASVDIDTETDFKIASALL
jgi:CMP-N,N'-diacetyllegionaminic acid synthase